MADTLCRKLTAADAALRTALEAKERAAYAASLVHGNGAERKAAMARYRVARSKWVEARGAYYNAFHAFHQ